MKVQTRLTANITLRTPPPNPNRPGPIEPPKPPADRYDQPFMKFDRWADLAIRAFIIVAALYLLFEVIAAVNTGAFERLVQS
jgi:hypothetical protein